MSYDRCVRAMETAVGRALRPDELAEVGQRMASIGDPLKKRTPIVGQASALAQAIQSANTASMAKALEVKRAEVLNVLGQDALVTRIQTHFGDNYAEGLMAFMQKSKTGRQMGKNSLGGHQDALAGEYIMGYNADLDKAGVREWVASGKHDLEIFEATHALNRSAPNTAVLATLPREAIEAAKVTIKWNEVSRLAYNEAGGHAGKLDGYVTRHTHDQDRIRMAGATAWLSDTAKWFDLPRMMAGVPLPEQQKVLAQIYTSLAAGSHLKFEDILPGPLGGIAASPAQKLSHERAIFFVSAAAEYEYNVKYGTGNLRETIALSLMQTARETALMRELGPSAKANYDVVVKRLSAELEAAGKVEQLMALNAANEMLVRKIWPIVDGTIHQPANGLWARRAADARALMTITDLGGAIFSSMSDIPVYASAARQQGVSMLSGMAEAIGSLFEGKGHGERMQILAELNVMLDSVTAQMAGGAEPYGGKAGGLAGATRAYFELNILRPWTDRLRGGFALASSHRLANHRTRAYADLPEPMQHLMQQYGILADEWDLMRQGAESHADGKAFLTPEGLASMPDQAFAAYAAARTMTPDEARRAVQDKLRVYFTDQASTAVLTSDLMTKGTLLGGTKAGTLPGESLRFFMQYKSFTLSMWNRVIARELYGYSDEVMTLPQAMMKMVKDPGGSAFVGMANLIAWTTLAGFVSMNLNPLSRGKTLNEPEDPSEYAKLFTAAMVRGGGLGFYGDILFGEMKGRMNRGGLEALLGPAWSRAEDLWGIAQAIKEEKDVTGSVITTVTNNTPFANLFYTRWALDYLILYRLHEWANPGYWSRQERREKEERGRTYIVPPSSLVQ